MKEQGREESRGKRGLPTTARHRKIQGGGSAHRTRDKERKKKTAAVGKISKTSPGSPQKGGGAGKGEPVQKEGIRLKNLKRGKN